MALRKIMQWLSIGISALRIKKRSAAYFELGKAYENGRGTEIDNVQAYMWYKLGAYEDVDGAASARDSLEEDMDTNEVDEAQRLTSEWLNGAANAESDMKDESSCDIER
nr:SEL1-like repeat protein [Desulfovibrio sp. Fe33]